MFVPGDPRFDEILLLATRATGVGLLDRERPRWRELCIQLLGELKHHGSIPERRQQLRAPAALQVEVLEPAEFAGLVSSSVGAGGLSLPVPQPLPLGTDVRLSIRVEQRPVPFLTRAQVVWNHDGLMGVAFIDLFQADRELLEGLAVRTLLATSALE